MRKGIMKRTLAVALATVLTAGSLCVTQPKEVSADVNVPQVEKQIEKTLKKQVKEASKETMDDGFTTPSGSKVEIKGTEESDIEVKGKAEAGSHVYTVKAVLKADMMLAAVPKVRYEEEGITALTKMTLSKGGKPITFYASRSETNPFAEESSKKQELSLSSDKNGWYYEMTKVLKKGTYTFTFTLPEELSKGAKVYLNLSGMSMSELVKTINKLTGKETGKLVEANTKATAVAVSPASSKMYFSMTDNSEKQEFWYKATLPGKRSIGIAGIAMWLEKTGLKVTVYSGKTSKTFTSEDTETSEGELALSVADITVSGKGTYYIKVEPKTPTDGIVLAGIEVSGPNAPKVTYWANGKGLVKGSGEVGTTAYAVVKGKKYHSSKIGSTGKFSIKIPKVAAGTKIKVYVKDKYGKKSSSKTVTVKKRPASPKITSYKKGTKVIKGKTIANGKVRITYGGKTYRVTAGKKGYFSTKMTKALTSGKQIKVYVIDASGNVSKKATYQVR